MKDYKSIISLRLTANQDSTIFIHDNTIQYSETGIRIKGGLNDNVRSNTITDIPLYYDANNVYGIITDSTQKIYIRDNTIDSLEYGITVNNSLGSSESRIWSNTITNCIGCGIGTGGDNSNLTVYCDTLEDNNYGWYGFNLPSLLYQGYSNIISGYPPGNYFGTGPYANISDITFPIINPLTYIMEGTYPANYYPINSVVGVNFPLSNIAIAYYGGGHCGIVETEKLQNTSANDSINNSTPWLGIIHPNPFNEFTNVPYYLPHSTVVAEVIVFDILGNKINSYPVYTKGIQANLIINSQNCSAGIYVCSLVVDGVNAGWKKLVIIK